MDSGLNVIKASFEQKTPEPKISYKYKAFISYSHSADNKLAPMLQSALHRFAKPFYKLRAINIFRDKTSLHLTPELWPLIQKALAESEFFILLASPVAADSPWVKAEIDEWLRIKSGSVDKLLIILTDGEIAWNSPAQDFDWGATTALPKNLQSRFKNEPLYSDLRWAKKSEDLSLRHPHFLEEVGTLGAALHGKPKDVMIGKDVQQHRIFKVVTSMVAIILIALSVGTSLGAYYANKERKEAERQSSVSLSRQLAAQAVNLFNRRLDLALLLAWEANRLGDSVEVRASLIDALRYSPHLISYLHGHTKDVVSLAFSSDHKTLASGSDDNAIILWDIASHEPIGQPLIGHTDRVTNVAFSPDGKILASASMDESIILWDVAKRQPLSASLKGHTGVVTSLAFSSDRKTLASGSYDQTIMIWNIETGERITRLSPEHTGSIRSVAFSPDGRLLASGGDPEENDAPVSITLWDTANFRPSAKALVGHKDSVRRLLFSPDGKTLASGSYDQTIILWDVASRQPKFEPLAEHNGTVFDLAFSPDGKRLATGGYDRRIILWDVATGKPLETLIGHGDRVFSVAFSLDGNLLASGDGNGTILLWDPSANKLLSKTYNTKDLDEGEAYNVIFSPDGSMLAVAGGWRKIIILWDVASRQQLGQSFTGHKDLVFDVAFSPNNKTLASGSADKTVILWNIETHQPAGQPLTGHTGLVMTVAFSPDGKIVASGSRDKTIIFWDAETHQALGQPLTGHTAQVNSIAFSPDGKILASGGGDAIILWDVITRRMIGEPITPDKLGFGQNTTEEGITKVVFSPDGQTLASSSEDGSIVLWDVATHQPKGQPLFGDESKSSVRGLAFSPDGKMLASSSDNGNIMLLDVDALSPIGQPFTNVGTKVAFSPKGMTLASSGGKFVYWVPLSDATGSSSEETTETPPDASTDKDDAPEPDVERVGIILFDLSLDSWKEHARQIANRDLTPNERKQYIGSN